MNSATHRFRPTERQHTRFLTLEPVFDLAHREVFDRPVQEGEYLSLIHVQHDPTWRRAPRPPAYMRILAVVHFYNRDGSLREFIGLKLQRLDPKPGLI